jgi:hypothetical protein
MKLFIKIKDGLPVDHPVSAENLADVLSGDLNMNSNEITDAVILENGYALFKSAVAPLGSQATDDNSYTLHEDGIVRLNVITIVMTQAEKLDLWVRRSRNFELTASDWTQMADASISNEKKLAWAQYRQELRDMTTVCANITDASDIVYPVKPV